MTGPRRLWSGDWSSESAAARARIAERRAQVGPLPDDPTESLAGPPPPPRAALGGARRWLLAAWRRLALRARALAAARPGLAPRGVRTRLVMIAVLAAVAGAAAMIGVEAATGAGTPAAAWVGVYLEDSIAPPGAMVLEVVPGSPAVAAGIQDGDIITAIDGRTVTSASSAVAAVAALRPGDSIPVTLDRAGQQLTPHVTLGTRPANAP